MNNQPKYGDIVTITDGEFKGKTGEVVSKVNYISCTVMTDRGTIIANVSDVAPYSPTPDMLAIPDDHVFQVEWRKIEDDECYENIIAVNRETNDTWHTTDMGYVLTSSGYSHYLTKADLLKLPFQK